jgi:asparagine synthase (glutamine-hydrolysing)
MAGIAGYFGTAQTPEVIQAMVRKLAHRGRDGEVFYLANPVFMGVRDTAAATAGLPAYSPDETVVIVFAGRISNYGALRDELSQKGMSFRNDSMGELLLLLYEAYGVNLCSHLRGKFIVAVHDTMKDLVFLARDRMGEEPLYYTTTRAGSFVFASEIKALLEHPAVQVTPDLVGVDAFLSLGYSPGQQGLFKGIHKLAAGHRLIWNPGLHVMIEPYWQWDSYMAPDASLQTDADFQGRFNALFEDAVHVNLADSDHPGVILNGQAEETAIAHAMIKQGKGVSSFGISFADDPSSRDVTQALANRLGTRHHDVICHPSDMEKLPEIVWAMDEPLADADVVVKHLLMKQARQEVSSILSGAGASDLLCGSTAHKVFIESHAIPQMLYGIYRQYVKLMPLDWFDKKYDSVGKIGPRCRQRYLMYMEEMRTGTPARRWNTLTALFDAQDKTQLYGDTMSPVMESFILQQKETEQWPSMISAMLSLQKDFTMQDSTLLRLDRMSMLSSIEAHAPFMDHPLVEFLLGAPDHLKFNQGQGKVLLKNYLHTHVPGLPERSHRAAALPLARMLTTQPLREMVDTCLSETSVKRRGLFAWEGVRNLLIQSRTEDLLYVRQVFALLMLELWFRIHVDCEKGWMSQ